MGTVKRFEDLDVWQKARVFTKRIYEISREGVFAKDYGLRDQICKSSVSIMANIAEGFERAGNREFIQFLAVAKGSAGEVRSHIFVALDQNYIDQQTFDDLYASVTEISSMIAGLISYLTKTSMKGVKFK
ncbi:MAG: four helix bundle protein [Omnitrophica bacterium RIFCSPLOWO2_12_FULL_44_17]|uniref:Four helix bundle protein n=1 Tax=Candidatus Danuiimicrobium aquiferis TaxID=1801832 RepID=A0A1G1KRN7_9BACT|nr:MAG: four helix bundle protein [Omnitrophica bacterium RIFCSPHIGHO2_02_FULL_45_28]OGW88655.1 MAG: four helix bundle protein [Omnitrophica bacterium RIFCSPHIGHO2_12_FULL_44_12]OGW95472.1 MAG: four helix bundle protein [Omnitrophica bacterium RIFCSPLOWO2_12_FULL_44_17]OGX03351.1 MAG: four helix bundle protein [Omnitrophica bacterium RIFCSPLOWO2_02_FULL_44_11]